MNIMKSVLTMSMIKCWNRSPREFEPSPTVEIFKYRLGKYLAGVV